MQGKCGKYVFFVFVIINFHFLKKNKISERADQILKSTKEVVKSLEEAKIAQEKAEDAIKKSNADIALARDDLNQVNIHSLILYK